MMQTVTIVGGNLFQLAAQYLQDATQWVRIAQLNGISDPWLTGPWPMTLLVPDVDALAGGGIGQQ